jgi:hypothetical protein
MLSYAYVFTATRFLPENGSLATRFLVRALVLAQYHPPDTTMVIASLLTRVPACVSPTA